MDVSFLQPMNPEPGTDHFSTLVIIFVHYVARSFCETIKLPKEMPKIAKCLKCLKLRYSIYLNRKDRATCRVVAEGEA
jgi:hypothetical protein